MRSLERRLQFGLALSLVLLSITLWFIGNQSLRSLTENFIASRLEHNAESLLGAMTVDPDTSALSWRRIDQRYTRPFSGHYYVIRFADDSLVSSRSLWDHTLEFPLVATGETVQLQASGPSGQRLLLLLKGFKKSGREFTLAVAEDLTPLEQERERFIQWFALLAGVGFIGLLLIQSVVIRRSFRSLEKVGDDVRRLEEGRTVRLSEDVPTEVLPLISEFNHLLRLLNQRLQRSRNAMGNLAHALKGPLNILTHSLVTSNDDDIDLDQARNQVGRIRQLMERELKRARLAGNGLSGVRFNPHSEIPDLVNVLRQVYRERELDLSYRIDPGVTPFGDREDLLELVGNLLDNACKWASSRVTCTVIAGTAVTLEIEDDGVGLEDQDISRLFNRGTRLDETVEGHGLGLAIVGDIVKLYDAEISFSRSAALGGLSVRIKFPASADESPAEA
ncbi:MAG: sensor histidine kinase [Candidatus Sedimenticola sp. 20ELBAFRAG]